MGWLRIVVLLRLTNPVNFRIMTRRRRSSRQYMKLLFHEDVIRQSIQCKLTVCGTLSATQALQAAGGAVGMCTLGASLSRDSKSGRSAEDMDRRRFFDINPTAVCAGSATILWASVAGEIALQTANSGSIEFVPSTSKPLVHAPTRGSR
jgi:hypothetical protein